MPGLGGIYRSLRPHPLCAVAQERLPLVKESFDRSSFSHGFEHSVYFVFQLLDMFPVDAFRCCQGYMAYGFYEAWFRSSKSI